MEREENIFRFEELRVYHKALDYVDWVYSVSKTFSCEDLSGPFHKAAQAVPLYIAEGSGESKQQFVTNLNNAKIALRECIVYTTIAKRLYVMTESDEEESRQRVAELTRMLNGFISSIRNKDREKYNRQPIQQETDIVNY